MKRGKSIEPAAEAMMGRGRTALYDWMWSHYDELPQYRRYRVNWVKMAAFLNEAGVKGRDEAKLLDPDTVRMTFMRVKADKEAEGRSKPSSAVRRSPTLPTPAPVASARGPEPPPTDDDEAGYDFDRKITRET